MKKSELKVLVKEAKKAVKADIETTVVAALTETFTKLGHDSKKLTKEIVKGSKKLAKKLAKDIKVTVAPAAEETPAPKAAKAPKEVKAAPVKKTKKEAPAPAEA